jgi:hypothetical protein
MKSLLLLLFFVNYLGMFLRTITGTVSDFDGGLVGAVIIVKGTRNKRNFRL